VVAGNEQSGALPAPSYELSPTHPAAIAAWARRDPDGTSMRAYDAAQGTWRPWTRWQLAAACGRVARSLADAGLRRGDRVGIVGPSSPAWLVAAEATQAAGGVTVGAYPTSAPSQLAYVFGHAGVRHVFVGDADLAARVESVRDQLPDLERISLFDDLGLDAPPDAADVDHFEEVTDRLRPEDIATIVYTSGTTGDPKGAVHSFRTIGMAAETVGPAMGYRTDDEYIVYLPLNHTAEQTYTIVLGAQSGWTLNFARSVATLPDDLRTVRPTVMFGVPRIFDKVREAMEAAGGRPGDDGLAAFGLDRLRVAVCGGAPLARELVEFYAARGIRMCNTYGMTEGNAIASAWDRPPRGDTCGVPFPGVDLRFEDDGEILVRSTGICLGYYRDPAATAEMLTSDGFCRTGDIGRLTADGEVQVIDRKKDIIITTGGKNISPSAIEHRLTSSPYVNQAVVVGNDRNYLAAVLELAPDAVGAALGLDPAPPLADLVARPDVAALVDDAVAAANAELSRPEQVKRWALLERPLTPGDPEVTPTLKVKRRAFESRYADLIDALYA
jgi:long-chain acyl-CoA synthetase